MLLERQIKEYITQSFSNSILRQIPQDQEGVSSVLPITIKMDLAKVMRNNHEIGEFIFAHYLEFHKIMEETINDILVGKQMELPEVGIKLSFFIQNCPFPKHNIQSSEFLSHAFQVKEGLLIYLKDVNIVKVSQPELYLFSWQEIWHTTCPCTLKKSKIKQKQTLLEIIKNKNPDFKEVVIRQVPKCDQCGSKMKNVGMTSKVYVNCQKIKVVVNMKTGKSQQEVFQKGQFDIYVDEGQFECFEEGDIIDTCCYYSAEPRIAKAISKANGNSQMILKPEVGIFMVSHYKCATLSSTNSKFFSKLSNQTLHYYRPMSPEDLQTTLMNYKALLSIINKVPFPSILNQNIFSTVKLIALNSLFNLAENKRVHFLVMTDSVDMLVKGLTLEGVRMRRWPTFYDHSSLILFLNSCHNSIVMITNPTKKDYQYLNNILKEKILKNLNFAFWIISEPNKDLKKEFDLEKLQLVIDLSFEKNINVCKNIYEEIVDQRLSQFAQKYEGEFLWTMQKERKQMIGDGGCGYYEIEEEEENFEEDAIKQNQVASEIIRKYFLKAREYKAISSTTLETIRLIAEGFSLLRNFFNQNGKNHQTKSLPLTILDSILAIFLQEQTSRNRHSSSNTLFSNEISKLMLNEIDCEISFYDFAVDEEGNCEQEKRYISRDDMFRRMVAKMMRLIYEGEIS